MSKVRWVRTYCDRDGEVVVLRQEVLLAIFPAGATYTFRCPRCAQRVVARARTGGRHQHPGELVLPAQPVCRGDPPGVLLLRQRSWKPLRFGDLR